MFVGVALLVEVPSAHAIIGGFMPAANDRRFDAIGAISYTAWLHGEPFWNNHFGAGTLVAPDTLLIARHYLSWGVYHDPFAADFVPPPPGYFSVRFRRNPDGSVASVPAGIFDQAAASTFYHVEIVDYILAPPLPSGGFSDLVLARLAHPVSHIDPIPVRFEPDSAFVGGRPLLLASWGRMTCPEYGGDLSFKLKVAETTIHDFCLAAGYPPCPGLYWFRACIPENPCQCGIAEFDSGGAVLVESSENCRLEIVGVISALEHATNVTLFSGYPEFPIPEQGTPCRGDLNNDGVVNSVDLGILLSSWSLPSGTEPGCAGALPCRADLNCDGMVNSLDLGNLLTAWGSCDEGSGFGAPLSPALEFSAPAGSEDDLFYQWLIEAGIEELFEWFEDSMGTAPDDAVE